MPNELLERVQIKRVLEQGKRSLRRIRLCDRGETGTGKELIARRIDEFSAAEAGAWSGQIACLSQRD